MYLFIFMLYLISKQDVNREGEEQNIILEGAQDLVGN